MKFACPHCQQHIEIDDSFAGTCVACPACEKEFVIAVVRPAEMPPPEMPPRSSMPASDPATGQEPAMMPKTEFLPPPPPDSSKVAPKFRVVSRPGDAKQPTASPKFRVVSSPRPKNKMKDAPVPRIRDGNPSGDIISVLPGKHRVEKVVLHAPANPTVANLDANQDASATIQANCPHCSRPCEVPETAVGTYVDCATCGKRFRVQKTSPVFSVSGGNRKVSMATALVFRCIVLVISIWASISCFLIFQTKEFEAMPIPALVFAVPAILSIVFSSILHFKCWSAIPDSLARTTPGMAVGGLFIPFFNLFWVFPSIFGLGVECETLARNEGCKWEVRLKALGLTLAILTCASYAMLLLGEAFLLKIIATDSIIAGDAWVDFVSISISLLLWAANGIPVLGSLVAVAEFIVWVLFYRGVTISLNRIAAEANTPRSLP